MKLIKTSFVFEIMMFLTYSIEGDCDGEKECMEGLICGNDNCPTTFGFNPEIDCCLLPSLDLDCTSEIPCGQNEGDCNSHDECQDGLFCGSNNCPASLGFDSEIDCCVGNQIMSPNYPHSYLIFADETWLLKVSSGYTITLQFHTFHVRHIIES